MTKIEQFPNLATETICSKYGGLAVTVSDIKGALQTGNPIQERDCVHNILLQIAINSVDWAFVEEWLKKPTGTEVINV